MASTSPDKWDEKSEPATPEIQEMVDKVSGLNNKGLNNKVVKLFIDICYLNILF